MVNRRNRYPARRRFLKQTAALSAGVAALAAPAVAIVPPEPAQDPAARGDAAPDPAAPSGGSAPTPPRGRR